jgi:hypothetical protein
MLWTVSASSATKPDSTTTTSWKPAVTPSTIRESASARIASRLGRIRGSTPPWL